MTISRFIALIAFVALYACTSKKQLPQTQQSPTPPAPIVEEEAKKEPSAPIFDTVYAQTYLNSYFNDSTFIQKGHTPLKVAHLTHQTYHRSNCQLIWEDSIQRQQFIALIENAWQQGLSPNDYHLKEVNALQKQLLKAKNKHDHTWEEKRVELDILLTDATFYYAYHMLEGKTKPYVLDTNWNYHNRPLPKNGDSLLYEALNNHTVIAQLRELEPKLPIYQTFKKWLVHYSTLKQEKKDWKQIHYPGKPLHLGDSSEAVLELKQRLVNYNSALHDNLNTSFDSSLYVALIAFQKQHGLDEDGVAGKSTYRNLNLTVDDCINSLRVNMERCRWLKGTTPQDYILVNIADFNLYLYRNYKLDYSSKVVVGKEHHETPVFESKITYIEFNPTWTVPLSIATKEILPKLKTDSNYLQHRNMVLLQNNAEVDPTTVDFHHFSERYFPFTIRQEPGPNNALGSMKFIFPNEHSVYLHDTPSKYAFDKTERAFSHGCVRVHNPSELAYQILKAQNYDRKDISSILASKETQRVFLQPQLPVMLMYWTCYENKEGTHIYFYRDLYGRDAKILAALDY